MTRVFIDTRSYRGCWVAAHAAGLFDLDAVALVAGESTGARTVGLVRKALRAASPASRLSVVEIPCHTVDAAGAVGQLARPGDVIVTESAPFAHEFLKRGGEAADAFGGRYTRQDIAAKVRRFHACRELRSLGIDPYKPRPYGPAECARLLESLKQIVGEACGSAPKC